MYELAIDELAAMAGVQGARCLTLPPGGLGRVGDTTVCDHCDSTCPARLRAWLRAWLRADVVGHQPAVAPFIEGLIPAEAAAALPPADALPGAALGEEEEPFAFVEGLVEEHKVLLRAAGYSDHRRQGSVHKYSSYLKKTVLTAQFNTRGELFEEEAWARAATACVALANNLTSTNQASHDKLFKNYMRGFSTFVRLAQP
tara:strand:- start:3422 stop:4021 length:600 start_codon:yes stop_codon:yes gene_type:complete